MRVTELSIAVATEGVERVLAELNKIDGVLVKQQATTKAASKATRDMSAAGGFDLVEFGKKWQGAVGMVTTAAIPITAAVGVIKKSIDFSKEGAQIEFTAGKFDRLSESISTTSRALLDDLRSATRGTMSDVELMTSATDFLSLGLAKTHDEAVRLTKVAGALGMNMNQLVLTLTNQTTMRFDQLGVAVDGFQERVDRLMAQGLSKSEAFTEAFLQQAEAQIATVGHIADTSAGQWAKVDASWANLMDNMKRRWTDFTDGVNGEGGLAGGLGEAIKTLSEGQEIGLLTSKLREVGVEINFVADSYRKMAAGRGIEINESATIESIRWMSDEYDRLVKEIGLSSEDAAKQINKLWKEQGNAINLTKSWADFRRNDLIPSIDGTANALAAEMQSARETQDALVQTMASYEEISKSMDEWVNNTASKVVSSLGREIPLASELGHQGLAIMDEVMGTSALNAQMLQEGVDAANKAFANTGDQAAYKAALQQLVDEGLAPMKGELDEAARKASDLYTNLMGMPENVKVAIDFDISGLPPGLLELLGGLGSWTPAHKAGTGADMRALGGPVYPSSTYLVGERGPESFTPQSAGWIDPYGGTAVPNVTINLTSTGNEEYDAYRVARKAAQILKSEAKRR